MISAVAEKDLTRLIEESAAQTRRHFEVVAERLESEIRLVNEHVAMVDQKIERGVRNVQEQMDRGFQETQAMIKFSHAELDKRTRTLENTVAGHEARLERLEGSHRPS